MLGSAVDRAFFEFITSSVMAGFSLFQPIEFPVATQ